MKFTAAGDVLIQQRMTFRPRDFEAIRAYIEKGDARFFNLETTLHYEGECYASQFSGGTYVRTDPECLGDILEYGFNILTGNNNHSMDFSYGGLLKTIENINSYDIPHSGLGENLGQAAAPCYLDTENGRVALISFCSTLDPSAIAGEQSRRVKGRPGINALRFNEKLIVPEEEFNAIVRVGQGTKINAYNDIIRAEGYLPPLEEGIYQLGNLRIEKGDHFERVLTANKEDMARAEKAIYEASLQADYVMVSVHSHEISGSAKEEPAQFVEEFSRFCIDKGAHAVIGHGPHLLRPIEIYKGCPIFYSLGDFVLQLYSVSFAPEEFFAKQGLNSDSTVHELLKARSANFTRGLMEDKKMFETVIPYWETDECGKLTHLELLPVTIMKDENKAQRGLPALSTDLSFIDRLAAISEPYGTKIYMKDGVAVCEW